MVHLSNQKEPSYITDRRKKKNIQEDNYSIDSNDSVHDDSIIKVTEDHLKNEVNSGKKSSPLTISYKSSNVYSRESIDSFDKKHVIARNSEATTGSSFSSIPHFMLPTEASLQRQTICIQERQRKSIVVEKKISGTSDKMNPKQSTKSSTKPTNPTPTARLSINKPSTTVSKQSTNPKPKNETFSTSAKNKSKVNESKSNRPLPRFMQPTKSYLQSLQPDPNVRPRKSIPAARIREVDTTNLPRYMKPTKAALHHLSEEKRKNEEENNTMETARVRVFVEPLSRRQPISSHDEFAINELRRELEKALEDSKKDLRLSGGGLKCTAIKKREGDLENEEEINARVKNAMKKIYPRYMQLTEAYRQKCTKKQK